MPSRRAFQPDPWKGMRYDDYAVMGLVSVRFQDLDRGAGTLVAALLADDPDFFGALSLASGPDAIARREKQWSIGTIVTTGLYLFRNKTSVAYSLAVLRFGADHPSVLRLQGTIKRCQQAEDERNTAIHSLWLLQSDWTGVGDSSARKSRRRVRYSTVGLKHRLHRTKGLTHGLPALDRGKLLQLANRMQQLEMDLTEIGTTFYPVPVRP